MAAFKRPKNPDGPTNNPAPAERDPTGEVASEMRCMACGVLIHQGDDFCRRCGARVAAHPTEPAAAGALRRVSGRSQGSLDEERRLWEGSFSWKGMLHWWLAALVATVALPLVARVSPDRQFEQLCWPLVGLVWGVLFVMLICKKLTVFYTVSNQRLIHETGFLYRRVNRVELIDIDDLRLEQGILERLVGTGRVVVCSSDCSDPVLLVDGIDRADELFELLDAARREERLKHGVHIETV